MNKTEYLADWEKIKADAEVLTARNQLLTEELVAIDLEMIDLVHKRMTHLHEFLGCTSCTSANRARLREAPCCRDERMSRENNPKPVEAMLETSPACTYHQAGEPQDISDDALEALNELFTSLGCLESKRQRREQILPIVKEKPDGRKDN